MAASVELAGRLSSCEADILELERKVSPLQKQLDRAHAQEKTRLEALARIRAEAGEAQDGYDAECRKLASGEKCDPAAFKNALQDAEAKVRGLELLIRKDRLAIDATQAELAEPAEKLAAARQQKSEIAALLKAALAVEQVGEKLRSLLSETESSLEGMRGLAVGVPRVAATVNVRYDSLHALSETLRKAAFYFR